MAASSTLTCRVSRFADYRCHVDRLPDDLLLDIFQKLDVQENAKKSNFKSISRVSKRWYAVANFVKTSLSITGFKAAKMARILHRFSRLASLNLGFLFDCSEEVLGGVGKFCKNLRELHISDSYKPAEGGSGLSALARGCHKLEVLSMHGYRGRDGPLLEIGSNCGDLRQLRLRSAPFMSDTVIIHIAKNCPKLLELDVSFTNISDESLEAIGKFLPLLCHLDLKHCKNVTGAGIVHVAVGCRALQVFHLGVVEVGDNGLAAIGENSKQLEELYLDYGWGKWGRLSRAAVSAVAKGCKQLKVLSLRGSKQVDDDILQGLSAGCPSLTSLDLHACERVGDAGLQAVIKGCKQVGLRQAPSHLLQSDSFQTGVWGSKFK